MKQKNIEKEKAVSMIALVVTIVVTILLSAVTIGFLLGDSGIIARTKEATDEYNNAIKGEYEEMEEVSIEIDDNNLLKMFKNDEIKIGDYVNYTIPQNGEFVTPAWGGENANGFTNQKYDVSNNGHEINWRILGLADRNGKLTLNKNEGTNILLISGSPVQKQINEESENEYETNPYLYMGKAEGYENSSRILNGICSIYLNERLANQARSISAEDINELLGIIVDNERCMVYSKNDENNNIDILQTMGNIFYYNENKYSANSYVNNQTYEKQESVVSTGYSYQIDDFKNSEIGELLFSQENSANGYSKSYWLDSKSVEVGRLASFCIGKVNMGCVNLGSGEFNSNGKWNVYGLGVYPVITLKPQITTDEVNIITKTEETWNFKTNISYYGNLSNYDTIGTMIKIFE